MSTCHFLPSMRHEILMIHSARQNYIFGLLFPIIKSIPYFDDYPFSMWIYLKVVFAFMGLVELLILKGHLHLPRSFLCPHNINIDIGSYNTDKLNVLL